MEINSHILKLTGKAELPKEIQIGHNYHVSLSGSIETFSESDNHDGTHNRTYTFKPVKLELLDELGETVKAKDPRKKSQLLRNCIWSIWNQDKMESKNQDEYYDYMMDKIIKNLLVIKQLQ